MQSGAVGSSAVVVIPEVFQARPLKIIYPPDSEEDKSLQVARILVTGHFGDVPVVRRTRFVPFGELEQNREIQDREVRIMQEVRGHPNVIEYLYHEMKSTSTDNVHFILVMQDGGKDLFEVYKRGEKTVPTLEEIFDYTQQIADGLAFIHSKQIVHRDIKPENLFRNIEGDKYVVRIGDFGFARDLKQGRAPKDFAVTYEYAAPETIARKPQRLPVDIHCFGVTIKDMLNWAGLVSPLAGKEERVCGDGKGGLKAKAISIAFTDRGHCMKISDRRLWSLVDLAKLMFKPTPKDRPDIGQVQAELRKVMQQPVELPALSSGQHASGPVKQKKSYVGYRYQPTGGPSHLKK